MFPFDDVIMIIARKISDSAFIENSGWGVSESGAQMIHEIYCYT